MHLVEQRRRLTNDKTRFTNRLTDTLKQYYPQAVDCFEDRGTRVFCDFLRHWPSLKQAKRARKATLTAFFREHHVHCQTVVEKRMRVLKDAIPLTEDPAVIEPNRLMAEVLVEQLQVTLTAIARFDAEIDQVVEALPDATLFQALPGAGHVLAPRLLAAFGEDRERFSNAAEVQKVSGIAPVTERSGKQHWVHWRMRCSNFLRQTMVEWAAQTITRSFWAGAYYRQQRNKGCSHQVAVRALAGKWIRILYRCWQTQTPYDESTYLNALKRRGSPLLNATSEIH
jgi:transposase